MPERPNIYGLTHECHDNECHVAAFVTTLRQAEHPADDCGLRDCTRCTKGSLNIIEDVVSHQGRCPSGIAGHSGFRTSLPEVGDDDDLDLG